MLLLKAKIQLALKLSDQAITSLYKAFEEWKKELKSEQISRAQEGSTSLLLDFRSRAMSLAALDDGGAPTPLSDDFMGDDGEDSKEEKSESAPANKQTIQLWLILAEVRAPAPRSCRVCHA